MRRASAGVDSPPGRRVTTIAAIWASLTPWADAPGTRSAIEPNNTKAPIFISTPHGLIDPPMTTATGAGWMSRALQPFAVASRLIPTSTTHTWDTTDASKPLRWRPGFDASRRECEVSATLATMDIRVIARTLSDRSTSCTSKFIRSTTRRRRPRTSSLCCAACDS